MLIEIDIGVDERQHERWSDWVKCKSEIAMVAIRAGGTISGAHGATREGDVELLPVELGAGGYELMKKIKRTLDPNNIMNPGKYLLDEAYE
jgi:glycolate oxidase